jgi:hypothetical protein
MRVDQKYSGSSPKTSKALTFLLWSRLHGGEDFRVHIKCGVELRWPEWRSDVGPTTIGFDVVVFGAASKEGDVDN